MIWASPCMRGASSAANDPTPAADMLTFDLRLDIIWCVCLCVFGWQSSALIFPQLSGQKFVLLLSDVGQLLARLLQLSLLPQHLLLSCNDLQARSDSQSASFLNKSTNQSAISLKKIKKLSKALQWIAYCYYTSPAILSLCYWFQSF